MIHPGLMIGQGVISGSSGGKNGERLLDPKHWRDNLRLAKCLDGEGSGVTPLSTVTVSKNFVENAVPENRTTVAAIGGCHFPASVQEHIKMFHVHRMNIVPWENENLLSPASFKVFEKLSAHSDLKRLYEEVEHYGIVIVNIKDLASVPPFVNDMESALEGIFPHVSMLGFHFGHKECPKQDGFLGAVAMLYDLKYFLPVYNVRKSRGMVVRLFLGWENIVIGAKVVDAGIIDVVACENRTNVFYLDGVNLIKKRKIQTSVKGFIHETVEIEKDRLAAMERLSASPAERAKMKKGDKKASPAAETAPYNTSNTWTTGISSGDFYYYYGRK